MRYIEDSFNCNVSAITGDMVAAWVKTFRGTRKAGISARTIKNIKCSLNTLFQFAKKIRAFPRQEPNPAQSIDVPKVHRGLPKLLPAIELKRLLDHLHKTDKKLCNYVSFLAFSGVRAGELSRIAWSEIDIVKGHIFVDSFKSKVGARRFSKIAANGLYWITPQKNGLIYEGDSSEAMKRSVRQLGIKWAVNCLRHSYATHSLSLGESYTALARNMGNSETMLRRHYDEAAFDSTEAQAWFNVTPEGSISNVIEADFQSVKTNEVTPKTKRKAVK